MRSTARQQRSQTCIEAPAKLLISAWHICAWDKKSAQLLLYTQDGLDRANMDESTIAAAEVAENKPDSTLAVWKRTGLLG